MTLRRTALPLLVLSLAAGLASGQAPDPAAERARLANERIQIEAERRAEEELARQQQGARPPTAPDAPPAVPARPPVTPAPAAAQPRGPVADMERTQRGLQQLRELGELKDAGHLTDEEFQRIKQRILDSHF